MVQSEDFPLRVQASSSEKLKDLLDRFIGFSVRGFEKGCRGTRGVRRVVEQTVRERAAHALLKQHEEESDLAAFVREPVGVAGAVPLDEAVRFHFAQVVSELGERIRPGREGERGENRALQVGGAPAVHQRPTMQQRFHQADHAGVVNLDPGDLGASGGDGQGEALKQWEIDMDVERGGLERGEGIGHGGEGLAYRVEVVERLAEPEIGESIAQDLEAQKRGALLVHPEHGALGAGAKDVVAMLDVFEERLQFAADPFGEPEPEDLRDFIGRQPEQADVAGALEELVDRQMATKDEVPAVLDLLERVMPTEVDRGAIFLGKFRTDGPGPVLEALAVPSRGSIESLSRP